MNDKFIVPVVLAVLAGAGSIIYNNTLQTTRMAENLIQHSEAIEKIGDNISSIMGGRFTDKDGDALHERVDGVSERVLIIEQQMKQLEKDHEKMS